MTETNVPAVVEKPKRQYLTIVSATDALYDTAQFDHMGRIAKVMAGASLVPEALLGNSFDNALSNCMMVVMQAKKWGVDPFMLAQEVYIERGRLAYSGKVVQAVLEGTFGIFLEYEYFGKEGTDGYGIKATGTPLGRTKPESVSGTVGEWMTYQRDNAPSQQWKKFPGRQLHYRVNREWARRWASAVLVGVTIHGEDDEGDRETLGAVMPPSLPRHSRRPAPDDVTDIETEPKAKAPAKPKEEPAKQESVPAKEEPKPEPKKEPPAETKPVEQKKPAAAKPKPQPAPPAEENPPAPLEEAREVAAKIEQQQDRQEEYDGPPASEILMQFENEVKQYAKGDPAMVLAIYTEFDVEAVLSKIDGGAHVEAARQLRDRLTQELLPDASGNKPAAAKEPEKPKETPAEAYMRVFWERLKAATKAEHIADLRKEWSETRLNRANYGVEVDEASKFVKAAAARLASIEAGN